ncbi:MAG TPA: hypothetical protein VFD30_05495 [Terriglobia bacterium]|nr:hypothetical protein [Terriglobia bacterium]
MKFPAIPIHFENQEYVVSVEIEGHQPEGTGKTAYVLYLALNELLTALAAANGKQIERKDGLYTSPLILESEKVFVC